jgi:hypothetical protein
MKEGLWKKMKIHKVFVKNSYTIETVAQSSVRVFLGWKKVEVRNFQSRKKLLLGVGRRTIEME